MASLRLHLDLIDSKSSSTYYYLFGNKSDLDAAQLQLTVERISELGENDSFFKGMDIVPASGVNSQGFEEIVNVLHIISYRPIAPIR
jgi:hypothetical protein